MLIGFHGRPGSGKDAAAARLRTILFENREFDIMIGTQWKRIAFADKLKESAAALFGVRPEVLDAIKNSNTAEVILDTGVAQPESDIPELQTDVSPFFVLNIREFLQRYGTEAHRNIFGPDFWVDAALPPNYNHKFEVVVVTDVRFPNELNRIHDLGGFTVRILGDDDQDFDHPSEQHLNCEYTLDNSVRNDNFHSLDNQLRNLLFLIIPRQPGKDLRFQDLRVRP